ncbi:MAG: adenylate/guanylate cyclase domain-containing protein, partial [Pseudomonadota bacterium]
MLALEGVERQRIASIRITIALLALAPMLAILAGLPDALYYHALLFLFVSVGWLQYLCARRWSQVLWIDYAFVAISFALLSFTLIYPNPLSEWSDYLYTPSVELRSNHFVFFFLVLAGLTFSFSPWILVWSGICGAVFWSLGRWWIMTRPGAEVFGPSAYTQDDITTAALIEASQHPRYVDMGTWIQEVVVFLIVALLLALVVQGSRDLLLRRAMEERRGANLARYLPAQMADQMAEADTPFLEDRQVKAAVLFTDVVGFTRWAEAHSPHEVVALLREMHGLVAEEVFRAGGVLDKFIGDGAMATFGATEGEVAAPAHAVDCVEAILARASALNAERVARGEVAVPLSVGAH